MIGAGLKSRIAAAIIVAGLATLLTAPALAFDYARYKETDLDDVLAQPRPKTGFDLNGSKPLRLEVTLVSYEETCAIQSLESTMRMQGFTKEQIDGTQVSRCIKVRSAKGKEAILYIQDVVRAFLPREVPLGSRLTLFSIHVFTAHEGPGLLVNEFQTLKAAPATAAKEATEPPCGCGSADFHPGVDMTSDKEGAPVAAMDDGVVIRIEPDDQAAVDAFNIGHCGRYVVVKHTYPNGHVVFSRYAQLGRIVGADGRPVAIGAKIRKQDEIGEVGPRKVLHFEVRPPVIGGLKIDAAWQARYGNDPSMDWSRYDPVNPQTFDADLFAGRSRKP
ncbi:M23 family metallopeptidase [Bradyrhizobium sp. Pear77]|uniref:M23 family metallopeptidase n=1 Tax=Bradyrhizobium altum TaxID=1571202 RepID=UPI001E4D8D0C|nr:M23 family metallopeptidase [Bradyrhizobium altum]MCC8959577.1 M23 family metallopeptidase [Bradyrhizobium altum]